MKRLLALLLAAVLLCGCSGATNSLGFHGIVKFEDMEYTRPDMEELEEICRTSCETALAGEDLDAVVDGIWDLYDAYDAFCTNYDLAYIHYHADLTDEYWQAEHDFCAENAAQADMLLEELFYALADSPLRSELESEEYYGPGYFDYYDGESAYDEEFLDLMAEEQELIGRYYELSEEAQDLENGSDAWLDRCTEPMADLLAELIALRQQIAAHMGYDSYPEFAWDCYYYRDYTPGEAAVYLDAIRQELVPVYKTMNGLEVWAYNDQYCSEGETFDWVRDRAEEMGGVIWEAFRLMEEAELYDLSVSGKKSGLSFELFLATYYQPYVFISSAGDPYDKLTFAHEFGHFACDYAAAGSYAGTDVLEIFSQGMEYLSLCYGDADQALADMKLADSLATYVEQAAYAAFEQQMYSLTGDALTGEKLLALYEQIGRDYGFDSLDWDPRDMVTVPHFYGNPLYIISYVVSNDAAMQLYQMELAEPGAGLRCYESHLDTEEVWFLAFLEEAEMENPMNSDRIADVRELMEARFGAQ